MSNVQVKSAQNMIDVCWHLTVVFAIYICTALMPDVAHANAIETVFCNVVGALTGTTGAAIATVAVIAVGVGALLGKISWGMALIVAVGIALVFGASSIVTAIAPSGTGGTCGSTTR
jgi:type IV secretion system protein VirB2